MTTSPSLSDTFSPVASLGWAESVELEFKSARGGVPSSLYETYSAFANTYGGVILLGVENDGSVSGLTDVERKRKNLWDALHNREKVSQNLLNEQDIQVCTVTVKLSLQFACLRQAARNGLYLRA